MQSQRWGEWLDETGAQRNYDQFRRGVPEAAQAIEELRSKRYAPSPRPRRRRPQAEPAEE